MVPPARSGRPLALHLGDEDVLSSGIGAFQKLEEVFLYRAIRYYFHSQGVTHR
jgi:hypothetical protein